MLDVVGARTQLRKAGARYTGRCPFHEERTPSFSVNAVDKLYYCFGCGAGGDLISFVKETENLDFTGAVEWLADRFRVELEYEEASPRSRGRARGDAIGSGNVLAAATAFYERCLWESSGADDARAYLAGRGLGEEICRAFRLGFAPGGQTLAQKARERGFTDEELLHGRPRQPPRQRLLHAAHRLPALRRARPRARLPGAQAARGRPAAGEVRQLAGERPVPEGRDPVRPRPRPRGDREAGPRGRRRGKHRRDRAAPGRARAGRRVDGHRAHRPAPAAALAADAEPLALLRRRRGRRGGDAARNGARGRAGLRDQGRHAAAGRRPGRPRRAASRSASRRREPYLVYRVRLEIERAADRQEAFVRVREILGRTEDSPDRQDAVAPRGRPARPAGRPAGRACLADARRARERSRPRCSRRATGSSGTRSPAASRIRSSCRPSRSSSRRTSTPSAHRALRIHLVQGGEPAERARAADRRARRACGSPRRSTRRRPRSCSCVCTERDLRRELARTDGDLSRTLELQEKLERVRKALELSRRLRLRRGSP